MRSFFTELFGLVKKHPLLTLLAVMALVVFAAAPFVWLWRKAIAMVAKVSPAAAAAIPKGNA